MAKIDRTVVRNQAYRASGFSIRERHNERKNECYGNGDIMPERSPLNIHFKQSGATYEQTFNCMVENKEISLRGLKKDAKIFDEMIFDVNTAYFDRNGGYDYAKQFFEEAYRLAVNEIGGEQYILSAIMHADARNKAESEKLGIDVFHYHLHVVYIPVVNKEIKWTERCKDPTLAGTVKEVVKQVSHSKKWPRYRDESGAWINSYSLLQDRFYEHMRLAGYKDFERGERGSTVENLCDLEYKTKKEMERAAALNGLIEEKQEQLSKLSEKISKVKQHYVTYNEIESMAKKEAVWQGGAFRPRLAYCIRPCKRGYCCSFDHIRFERKTCFCLA